MIDDAVEACLKMASQKDLKSATSKPFWTVATGLIHPPKGPGYEMCQWISLSRAMINKVQLGVDRAGGQSEE